MSGSSVCRFLGGGVTSGGSTASVAHDGWRSCDASDKPPRRSTSSMAQLGCRSTWWPLADAAGALKGSAPKGSARLPKGRGTCGELLRSGGVEIHREELRGKAMRIGRRSRVLKCILMHSLQLHLAPASPVANDAQTISLVSCTTVRVS